jgi:pectin methylesterase-like acyl-CoA thioesterase
MKFRSSLNAFVIITGILISVTSLPIGAATRCVNPGGTGGCFSSIQRAIDAAAPGDTILIGRGIYTENLVVPKSLTLLGVGDRDEHRRSREDGERQGSENEGAVVRPSIQTRIHARAVHGVTVSPATSFWSRPTTSRFEG